MSQHVYWLLKVDVNSGKLDDARSLMQEMVAATQADEPGALNYEWNFNADESQMHIYERYADSAATMIHLGNFGSKFAERFLQCFTPTALEVYGDASDEVRAALAPFGAVHYVVADGFAR